MVNVLRGSGDRPMELTAQPSVGDLRQLVKDSGIEAELHTDLWTGARAAAARADGQPDHPPDGVADPPEDLPPTVHRAVYRTVQEALTNVRKHAPGATATVRVRGVGSAVHVTVTNCPPTRPGLPLPGGGYGLVGIRQRAELLGGAVTSGPTAAGGYELRLELPLDPLER